jgi:hypothetical protein
MEATISTSCTLLSALRNCSGVPSGTTRLSAAMPV